MTVTTSAPFNRGTGLLVIEVRQSNPNGDPDAESDPRALDGDGRGIISPVSFKRKLRDLIGDSSGPIWNEAARSLGLLSGHRKYGILENRGRDREAIYAMDAPTFSNAYWDARLFGNTFLEAAPKGIPDKNGASEADEENTSAKPKTKKPAASSKKDAKPDKSHFISTGVVQFGPGVSIAPIEIERLTTTNKAGVEGDKDRGMAPLGWRVVRHAVYAMPFFVNPMMAMKTGSDGQDLELLKFLIPHAYRNTASAMRPFVEIRHAWYAEHTSPLGSCPDSLILDSLVPTKQGNPDEPSTSIAQYSIPTDLPPEIRSRLASLVDLCNIS